MARNAGGPLGYPARGVLSYSGLVQASFYEVWYLLGTSPSTDTGLVTSSGFHSSHIPAKVQGVGNTLELSHEHTGMGDMIGDNLPH